MPVDPGPTYLRMVLEHYPLVCWATDRNLITISSTGSALRGLGLEEGQIVGMHIAQYSGTTDPSEPTVAAAYRALEGKTTAFESNWGGREFVTRIGPLLDATGAICGTVGVALDVTEARRVERDLARLDKLDSLGTLAGGIAHDFNNMLTAILGNASVVAARLPPESPLAPMLAETLLACERARHLTRQLLTFSRGGAPILRPLSVGDLLIETAHFMLRGRPVRFEADVPDDVAAVDADEDQLSQVVGNLLLNAVEATASREGTVWLRARNVELGEGSEIPLGPGRYVRVEVGDDGEGIPPDRLTQVFDPYFSTRERGRGLGLAIVHSVVARHHGHVGVRARDGGGTVFTIHLRASDSPAAPRRRQAHRANAAGTGRVLVMDDDASVRGALVGMLRTLGYEAESTSTGEDAVTAYRNAMDGGQRFAAVILDLTVPGEMGGAAALPLLLAIDPDVRAIVCSGYSESPVLASYRELGFAEMLAKPVSLDDLAAVLQHVLG